MKKKRILEIRKISKSYNLSVKNDSYLSIRENLFKGIKKLYTRSPKEIFWALKDISFDVNAGDRIGIIGKNGAGKSTLLKIISKITPPTSGYIKAKGRIASLLEVGTGFHPELTGRENIFLNGSILGLSRAEIKDKMDEIIDFSGVEKFLDSPLKHFSSGMQLRLAFSVAAFLEPEILVIDEVLAVGDIEFQKKCLGKMDEISLKNGRTILFVSHDLRAISMLCNKAILIDSGRLAFEGSASEAIDIYNSDINSGIAKYTNKFLDNEKRIISISAVRLFNAKGINTYNLLFGEFFHLSMDLFIRQRIGRFHVIIGLERIDGTRIFTIKSIDVGKSYIGNNKERKTINVKFLTILTPGKYKIFVRVVLGKGVVLDSKSDVILFNVSKNTQEGIIPYSGGWGVIRPNSEWS